MTKTSVSPKQFYFFNNRFAIVQWIFIILFFILFFQVIYLQLIKGQKYSDLSLNNREQYIPIQTYRGEIFGRDFDPESEKNIPLVTNEETMGLYILPIHLKLSNVKTILYKLSFIADYNYTNTISLFTNRGNYFEPFLIKDDVPIRNIAEIAEVIQDLPGIYWEPIYYRNYPNKNLAAHTLGFVGSISKNELKYREDDPQYHLNSIIGKIGIEKFYDTELRGKEGKLLRIVDARNRIRKSFVVEKPVPGHNLVLTLDKRIQQIAEDAMKRERGSVIVLDPYTGEILALVSKPDFDPNIFIKDPDIPKIIELNTDPEKPFLNRAIQAKYPPGSVFKIVTATAGIEEEVVNPNNTYYCKGYYKFENDDRVFHCTGYHGYMNIYTGLEFSCNVFFFNLSYYLGSKKIIQYAEYYGYGTQSGIDIPGELPGFLPSHKWKKKTFAENWYDGDTINLGIGQGFILSTVLQVSDMMAAVANDGLIYQPHLLKAIYNAIDGEQVFKTEKKLIHNIPIDEANLNTIKKSLNLVTLGGTAKQAGRFSKISLAGKTSTAQNTFGDPHAWFTCYAPYNTKKDRVVVTVFLENAGGGGEKAAPVGIAILNAIFKGEDVEKDKKKIKSYIDKAQYERYMKRMDDQRLLEEGFDQTEIQF
ncbi:MAG: penicillin-binding protein 2 [Spirochaetes bacterium]|nr:penicillin-binding protein 2 [Spirochaetota bacterium]